MKKSLILPVIAAGLAVATTSTVLGQQKSIGLTVRAGIAFPVDQWTSDRTNRVWPNGGIEYQIGTFGTKQVNPRESLGYSVSVDIAGTSRCGDGNNWGNGNRAIINVPLLANLVYRTNGFVLSAGAGVAFNNSGNNWRGNNFNNNCNNCVGFGYQGTVGYEFAGSTPIGIEARFLGNSNSWLNTISANVFVRF